MNIVKPAASNLESTISILSFFSFIYYETLVYADASVLHLPKIEKQLLNKRCCEGEGKTPFPI